MITNLDTQTQPSEPTGPVPVTDATRPEKGNSDES
jgi:hypothetical protein